MKKLSDLQVGDEVNCSDRAILTITEITKGGSFRLSNGKTANKHGTVIGMSVGSVGYRQFPVSIRPLQDGDREKIAQREAQIKFRDAGRSLASKIDDCGKAIFKAAPSSLRDYCHPDEVAEAQAPLIAEMRRLLDELEQLIAKIEGGE